MAELLKKPKSRAQMLGNTIELPDPTASASEALAKIGKNRKTLANWNNRQQKALAKLKAYKKEMDAAHKDVAGCKARDERLSKKWAGLADKIIRLQAAAKSKGKKPAKGGKDPEQEIAALHNQAATIYDEIDAQYSKLQKKYEKLATKLDRGLNNLPL